MKSCSFLLFFKNKGINMKKYISMFIYCVLVIAGTLLAKNIFVDINSANPTPPYPD